MKQSQLNNVKFYIGQNAQENWKLLEDSANINPDYIWFHLNSFSSPYVIMYATIAELQTTHEPLNQHLQFGAQLCKENSKYKFLKDIKVMYVPIKKLTKTEMVGEVHISGKAKLLKL